MTRLYREVGVVLRTYKLGESDRIVVLMTESRGKLRAVAKGVRKTGSRFGGRLEPMSHLRLQLHRTGRDLDIIDQVESVTTIAPLIADLDHLTQGMAVLEAVDQVSLDREPNPALYRMLVGVLRTISTSASPLIVPAFFWKLLAIEGVRPQLDGCVRCGQEENLVSFDMEHGGVLCRNCRSGAPLSQPALDLMRQILGGQLSGALAVASSRATHEVGTHATKAVEYHIERRLRSVSMFERVEALSGGEP